MKYSLFVFDWEGTLVDSTRRHMPHWKPLLPQDEPPVQVFLGTKEVLLALKAKGCKLAVATGANRARLNSVMHAVGLDGLFDATVTVDEAPSKPDPSMLLQLMDQLHTEKKETVMIGDSQVDMEMAENAGVDAIFMQHNADEALYPVVIRDITALLQG